MKNKEKIVNDYLTQTFLKSGLRNALKSATIYIERMPQVFRYVSKRGMRIMKKVVDDFEKRKAIVLGLKPIDDAFFEKLMEDKDVCEEVLRILLEDPELTVVEVVPQDSIKNLQGRSVRLDAFCILGSGVYCNVEVQKENVDNHVKRVRFNSSVLTANISDPGDNFENVPEVYMVYISRFDVFGKKKTVYHAEMCVKETGEYIEDGLHEIYVNTKIDDGSTIAELMKCFEQEIVDNEKFPKFSARVQQFKREEKEVADMCSSIENYAKEYAKEREKDIILRMLRKELAAEEIAELTNIPLEEILQIRDEMLCHQ